jgi:hypothetical protein
MVPPLRGVRGVIIICPGGHLQSIVSHFKPVDIHIYQKTKENGLESIFE